DPEDLGRSAFLETRVAACREERLSSRRAATRTLASTPHLFAEIRQPTVDFVAIPSVVSENRPFFLASHLSADVIFNANATAEDPDGFLFGLISSSMFLAWLKAVGGRLESRLRFSNTIVWNNFPLPSISTEDRTKVIAAGKGVISARDAYPSQSLAQLYEPASLPPDLAAAHAALDVVIDGLFELVPNKADEESRQAVLFREYATLDAGLLAGPSKATRGRR
ncbi:type IIL restriction-modification enzyme MmeI, partial [Nocardioides sp. GCM10030258]|uniref:type IIL restriction-modification enzyme MmeI n=1 Tax=unclassified Nocardioides TaxID=2615069 RepID=UPI0036062D56